MHTSALMVALHYKGIIAKKRLNFLKSQVVHNSQSIGSFSAIGNKERRGDYYVCDFIFARAE